MPSRRPWLHPSVRAWDGPTKPAMRDTSNGFECVPRSDCLSISGRPSKTHWPMIVERSERPDELSSMTLAQLAR